MITVVVEGESDREAAKSVVKAAGHSVGRVVVTGGHTRLDPKLANYNKAARRSTWVVFRDSDSQCPVALRQRLTADINSWSPRFSLRIAHSMTEAWLLADREGFARYFKVAVARVPMDPESEPHAKRKLLQLCATSRARAVRSDVVTEDGKTGPLYVVRLNEFASTYWDAEAAAENSESLRRAIEGIRGLP